MSVPVRGVDAFTDRPFSGNPAAVCLLPSPAGPAWMQDVAREMALSETAFCWPEDDGFGLRWFTPEVEVDLCGHATLATAHVLWEEGEREARDRLAFHTRSGLLTAVRRDAWIELDFPSREAEPCPVPPGVADVLGAPVAWTGRSPDDLLCELDDEDAVRGLRPDMGALRAMDVRGLIATAPSAGGGTDFVSRFFAPAVGVPEDPVTGSAHCTLGPFWAERLGRSELVGYQASARGGTVRVRVEGDRVALGGRAVTVMRGELL